MWSTERESVKENCQTVKNSEHGKWYGPCTPAKSSRPVARSPGESPRLSLALFAKTPRLSFGKVKLGNTKVKRVIVDNPSSIAQSIRLDKWPEEKGFTLLTPVDHGEPLRRSQEGGFKVLSRSTEFTVPAMSEMDLPILWKPDVEGNYRETITLKLGDFNRLQLVIFGNAVDNTIKPKQHKMKTLLPEGVRKGQYSSQKRKISTSDKASSNHKAVKRVLQESNKGLPEPKATIAFGVSATRVKLTKSENKEKGKSSNHRKFSAKVAAKGVAPSGLTLIKKSTTKQSRNIPRHPLPYAAKNMYYDENWLEKQERGFVKWLNYILTPPDELTTISVLPETSSIFLMDDTNKEHNQPLAPTKEALSLRTYTAKRKMARLRRSACLLYQSQPVAFVTKTIECEIEKNRLSIRSEKHFHQDLGIKETIVKTLLSYNSLWLRIGLETIYGEILPLQSNNDVHGLKRFLKSRFLANPDLAKNYRHATVAEYYRPGYFEALEKFTLKKFLLLILFLDKAKLTRLIDHDPCLFKKDAEHKSSRDLLLAFSRDYLKGEGDVTKHLSFLNYTVSHVQAPLDEMDYAVKNLAVDLRDGLRVTRVIELLTQNWTLSPNLRVPAISRLQKIHNVGVALDALKDRGVLLEDVKVCVDPRHIVDGHREKTLAFLWMVILHFQVNLVVNEKQIKDEISFLKKYHRLRNVTSFSDVHCRELAEEEHHDVYLKSEKLGLLLDWCRSVCRLYGVKVDNFTVSMSDGRVLCYLIHYYHPCLLREEDICQDTPQTCNPYTADDDSANDSLLTESWTSSHNLEDEGSSRLQQLKGNERMNHDLYREKVLELGGVPSMLKFTDMSMTIPDEKVVITYISYLCARLLDLRTEGRAARTIQLAWRRYILERRVKELKKKNEAVLVIQKYLRSFLEKKRQEIKLRSTLIIQAFFRGYKARRDLRRCHCAATVIQMAYRSFVAMKRTQDEYKSLKQATLRMQALVRGKFSRRDVKRMKAARLIQSYLRRYVTRRHFLSVKTSTITLQACVRGFLLRRRYLNLRNAGVIIQRRYRALRLGRITKRDYTKVKTAVTMLQARRRGTVARRKVARIRAAIVVQKSVRMWRCRRAFLEEKKTIIKLQSLVRRNIARKRYKKCVLAARVLQQRWRAYQLGIYQRKSYCQLKASAVTIQSHYRSRIVRQKYLLKKKSATVLQSCIRGFLARKEIEKWKRSCCVIQKYFRGYQMMREMAEDFRRKKEAVIKLQAWSRARAARARYLQEKKAIAVAQTRIRGHLVRKRFMKMKAASRVLQTRYRALREMRTQRESYVKTHNAIVTLQASLRGYKVRKLLEEMNTAATLIQSNYRRYTTRANYIHLQRCVAVIQIRYRAWRTGRQIADDYKRVRSAVLVLQKHARGYNVRKNVRRMSEAAVTIQANFRRYRSQKAYSTLRASVLTIQRSYRLLRVARTTREDYVIKRACVIRLQSALRRALCVREFQRKKEAARVVQTRWRAVVVSRQVREEYHCIRGSVITIQAFVRGVQARKSARRERAAIKVQSCWRGMLRRRSFVKLRNAAISVQSRFRMLTARRRHVVLKARVLYLQRLARANQLCKRQMLIYEITRGAVITLQAAVRGHRVRKELQRMKEAAIRIQSSFRRYSTRQGYLKLRRNVLVVQRRRRATTTGRRTRAEYNNLRRTVVSLQSRVRGRIARRNFQESCKKIVKLQTAVRGFLARSRYHRMREAAMTIQQRYRSCVLGSSVHAWYHIQRGACITVQANTRAWIHRRRYLELRKATQVIQVYLRATIVARKQRHEYLTLRSAAVTIQGYARGWAVRCDLRRSRAATCVQSLWRMYVVRREYKHHRLCVVRLQSLLRMWLCRRRYEDILRATITVQRRFRANQLCRKERDLFCEKKGACFLIQHCYRYYRQRCHVLSMLQNVSRIRTAALVVQRRYRANQLMKRTRENYLTLCRAVVTLQTAYRGYQARVFIARLRAVVVIQSYYRGYRQRSEYTKLRNAVVKIQALTRGKQACRDFRKLREAAIVIQRRERARCLGNSTRNLFLKQRNSAVVIQSCYRGYQARARYQRLQNATVKLQALVRGRLARSSYTQLCAAVVIIQRRERARILGSAQRWAFLKQKTSAVLIQSWCRGRRERTRFLRLKNATIRVQALARGKRARVSFKKTRGATVVIQRRERARVLGNRQRHLFLGQRRSAVLIQSLARRHQERTRYLQLREAITKVQACVRGRRECLAYRKLREAAVVIQRRERARVLGNRQRNLFLEQRRIAVLIQSLARRHQERTRYLQLREAITKIQACVRGRRECLAYRKLREASVVIQRRERARVLGNRQRHLFLEQRRSAVLIQSLARRHQERTRYLQVREAITKIQACVRGRRECLAYRKLREAAVVIQRRERARVLGKSEREHLLTQRKSVVLIQSWLRGQRQRREYLQLRNGVVKIQACLRGYRQRRSYVQMQLAAVCIQKRYRAYTLGKEVLNGYQVIRNAVITIQSYHRGTCGRQFVKSVRASITIQTAFRRYVKRSRYLLLRNVAIRLQAAQRMRTERQKYRELRYFTTQLQRRVRANQMGRREKTKYQELRRDVIRFQALCRGWKAREYVRRIRSARVIQRRYRASVTGQRARVDFIRMRTAAVKVQSYYRQHVARRRFQLERAARIIQAYARGHQARRKVEVLRKEKAARLLRFSAAVYVNLVAIRLQRAYRKARAIALFKAQMDRLLFLQRWWRAKMQRSRYLRVRYLVCVIQRTWRRRLATKHQAAARIQALIRTVLAKRAAERRKQAVVTIQSFWRGHCVRKRCNSAKIRRARRRILLANANVTEPMKLCNRTRSALDYLLKCKNLTTVLEAFVHLEVASRFSHKCTEKLVVDNALGIIFKVIRNSNRSLAHIEIIKHALAIFINVSKCPTTQGAVVTCEPNSLDTLVELACIFREKTEIFLEVSSLLTILCKNEAIKKSLLSMDKAVGKIKSIYTLTKRKYALDLKSNNGNLKRRSVLTHVAKKNTNNYITASTPLSAITALVKILGLLGQ